MQCALGQHSSVGHRQFSSVELLAHFSEGEGWMLASSCIYSLVWKERISNILIVIFCRYNRRFGCEWPLHTTVLARLRLPSAYMV